MKFLKQTINEIFSFTLIYYSFQNCFLKNYKLWMPGSYNLTIIFSHIRWKWKWLFLWIVLQLCPFCFKNCVYRWTYELSSWTNTTLPWVLVREGQLFSLTDCQLPKVLNFQTLSLLWLPIVIKIRNLSSVTTLNRAFVIL